MLLLIFFAFISGVVTILSPCILPLLPIILASSSADKSRPLGVVLGFIGSFTLFTLALSSLVKVLGFDANLLRNLAVVFLFLFGLTLFLPFLRRLWEQFVSRHLPQINTNKSGFWGGILLGISLGIVWTPCVGPILASVIALAASSTVTITTFLITLAYSVGTAIPLAAVMRGSHWFISRLGYLKSNSNRIQQFFGLLMIATSFLLYFQLDRRFQNFILTRFPGYGSGLTGLEAIPTVQDKLNILNNQGGNMDSLKNYGPAPDLVGGVHWINSDALKLSDLKGKVVLLDFWTYSCVNCLRTLPYLKAWYDKYDSQGLVIIGIHSPEFEFEKNSDNVQRAVKDFGITYPVVQDNNFAIWNAYSNQYWPAKYLLDKNGTIRYTHFGEGGYDQTEMVIQELLGEKVDKNSLVNVPSYSIETRSPETYVGYERLNNLVSSPDIQEDTQATYSTPDSFPNNGIGFRGDWTVHSEFAEPSPGSSLVFHFDAKEVNLVMRPVDQKTPQKIRVLIDGKLSQELIVNLDQLYNLVKLGSRENHYVTIEFPDGGVEVYAFTFG